MELSKQYAGSRMPCWVRFRAVRSHPRQRSLSLGGKRSHAVTRLAPTSPCGRPQLSKTRLIGEDQGDSYEQNTVFARPGFK